MTQDNAPGESPDHQIVVVSDAESRTPTAGAFVQQPAKVMRIGSMIRQLLEEVKSAPLDEASRARLAGIYESSIKELEAGLAPELIEELERLAKEMEEQAGYLRVR